jgi:hypothetical protein
MSELFLKRKKKKKKKKKSKKWKNDKARDSHHRIIAAVAGKWRKSERTAC